MSSPSDDQYAQLMREILLAEPVRGVATDPSRILDHVYIGSQSNAESLRLLRQLGITHVLNCAGYKGPRPFPNASPYEGLGIDYYEFQAEDTDQYDICRHFPEAFAFLERVRRRGGTALVHCALGINRSGAVCLGYLMTHAKIPLLEATSILKKKRRIVLANRAFQRQLVRFARSRGLLDPIDLQVSTSSSTGDDDDWLGVDVVAAFLKKPTPKNDFVAGHHLRSNHKTSPFELSADRIARLSSISAIRKDLLLRCSDPADQSSVREGRTSSRSRLEENDKAAAWLKGLVSNDNGFVDRRSLDEGFYTLGRSSTRRRRTGNERGRTGELSGPPNISRRSQSTSRLY